MMMKNQNDTNEPIHFVIVGGVAAGASAAARARRLSETARITVIERGPDVSFANCGLPYHIGGEIADRERLAVQTPASLKALLNVDVWVRHEVRSIDRERKCVLVRAADGSEQELAYDKLLLAPGAVPLRPPLPGIDDPRILTLRDLQDMDRIKRAVGATDRVAIIGAGFIGLEMAEQLVKLGKSVQVIELQSQVLPQLDEEMARPIAAALVEHGVDLILGDGIKGFNPGGDSLGIELHSGRRLEAGAVILSIGVRPETSLAKESGLTLGGRGHIVVNEWMQTSDPNIYAAGDAVETLEPILGGNAAVPLGGPANRQGRLVADHIWARPGGRPYPGSLGTAIVRVFETTAGITGWSERRLVAAGVDFGVTVITENQHAGYFPNAQQLTIKALWHKSDGRLLGAQVTGSDGVDKRLDVLATAIRGRMSVEDLAELELAYAPPFGSAKDPVNLVGMAASNVRAGLVEAVAMLPDDPAVQTLDVRPAAMVELSPLPGAIAIPLADLRARLSELDRKRPVVTVCAMGKTSYFAARILRQHGFDVRSLNGGLRMRVGTPSTVVPGPKEAVPSGSKTGPGTDEPTMRIDATGLSCPGPIMKVKEACERLEPGEILEVTASDAGFATDFPAFCTMTGCELLGVTREGGNYLARLRQGSGQSGQSAPVSGPGGATLVVFSQEMDKAMASLVIANGALAMGGKVTLFFTFWGLNVLRKNQSGTIAGKSLMDRMFGWMMPRGVDRLPLSNMHMAGLGTRMMKWRMASKNLPNLPGLLADAQRHGARIVACSMSMDAMGIRPEELIDGVEIGGVADFLAAASKTQANLFI